MPRKLKKGYYVKGEFVAEGSARDQELTAELKGTWDATRTDQKKHSHALRDLGKTLLTQRPALWQRLALPERLHDALQDFQRLNNFEAQRRQTQLIGKLMRQLDEGHIERIRQALYDEQHGSGSQQTQTLLAEQWREQLLADDAAALPAWLESYPDTDIQALRTLIRQARKDLQAAAMAAAAASATAAPEAETSAPPPSKKSRAYRELFQQLRQHIEQALVDYSAAATDDNDDER
ncbi:MAG: DUF615 domain-containing protein [Comamonas sp.]|nr:DUF615 domain-containing protein [Comamonas sp.]